MNIYTVTNLYNNYGSILQAFALQSRLKELGVIPYVILDKSNEKKGDSRILSYLKVLRPRENYSLFKRIKLRFQARKFTRKNLKLQNFIKDNISTLRVIDKDSFFKSIKSDDILLAGSDQIWNVLNSPLSDWYTFQDVHDLKIKRYSYAASIGLSQLSNKQIEDFTQKLPTFQCISLRERHAYAILKPIFPDKVREDLDPTLLYDGAYWKRKASERIVKEPYIFVYMLRPSRDVIAIAKKVAKEKKCKILYTGLEVVNDKAIRTIFDAGIEDFLSLVCNSETVITNSFHGTVFSILFEKPFLSVSINSTSSRVQSILEKVGLMSQFVSDSKEKYSLDINFTNANQVLAEKRIESLDYLKCICSKKEKL